MFSNLKKTAKAKEEKKKKGLRVKQTTSRASVLSAARQRSRLELCLAPRTALGNTAEAKMLGRFTSQWHACVLACSPFFFSLHCLLSTYVCVSKVGEVERRVNEKSAAVNLRLGNLGK